MMHDSLSSERIKGALNLVRIRWDGDYNDCAVGIAEENKLPMVSNFAMTQIIHRYMIYNLNKS